MSKKKDPESLAREIEARIEEIRRQIGEVEDLCRGTLMRRWKVCGKPTCRCAQDPKARHGPYCEWAFMERGQQVHRQVTEAQAELIRHAIANHKAVSKLLRRWERETKRKIDALRRSK